MLPLASLIGEAVYLIGTVLPFGRAVVSAWTMASVRMALPQAQLSAAHLAELLKELTVSPDKRVAMAKAAYELRNVQVVEKIYDICEEVCR